MAGIQPKITSLALALSLLVVAQTASAAETPAPAAKDGRAGFFLSVNAGPGFGSVGGLESDRASRLGLALNINLGWGLSDQLILHFSSKELWFAYGGEITLSEVAGFGATWFFDAASQSAFVQAVALSWSVFAQPTGPVATQVGPGAMVAFGYEFSPHMLAQVDVGWGSGDTYDSYLAHLTVGYAFY